MKVFFALALFCYFGMLSAQPLSQEKASELLDTLGSPKVQFQMTFSLMLSDIDSSFFQDREIPLSDLDSSALAAGIGSDALDHWRYLHLFYDSYDQLDLEQAEAYYMEAGPKMEEHINSDPRDSIAVEQLANMFLKAENAELAFKTLAYGLEQFPNNPNLYRLKYQLLNAYDSDAERVEAFLEDAVKRFPSKAEFAFFAFLRDYELIFESERMSEERKAALLAPLKRYKEDNPNEVLAEVLWRYGNAFIDFNIVLYNVMQDDSEWDLTAAAKEFISKEERDYLRENIRTFKKLQKKGELPKSTMHHLLAMQYFVLGNSDKAMSQLEKEAALLPKEEQGDVWESYYMIKLLPRIEDQDYQVRIIEEKHAAFPEPKDFLIQAVLAIRSGDLDLAEELLNKALPTMPASEIAYQIAANIALRKGNLEAAEQHINRIRQINTGSIYGFFLQSIWEGLKGDRAQVLARMDELLEHLPDNESAQKIKLSLTEE